MNSGFARSKDVYRELRAALASWAKGSGFRRWSGTPAGWCKPHTDEQVLGVRFECGRWALADMGNDLTGYIELVPASSPMPGNPVRQAPFEHTLPQAALDELAHVQGAINRRRPPLPRDFQIDAEEDTGMGHHLRRVYEPAPVYREGESIFLGYHGLTDVQDLARFIASVLPGAITRFLEGRISPPIPTTPPHLVPKWLKNLK